MSGTAPGKGTARRAGALGRLGWRDLPALALTLAVGAAGGAVFNYFQLPLAWMLGAMCATTPFALARVPLVMDSRLRMVMIVVLGMMIGGAFSPDILAKAGRWWISMAGMAVFVAGVGAMIYVYYVRVTGLDRRTALFASLPGGLNEMAVMGADMGADDRMISLAHSVRIFIVVMTIPFLFQALGWYERGASAYSVIVLADVQTVAVIKIVGGSLAGMAFCRLVRFPSPVLIGAMLGSAAVHITGWTDAQLPTIFITLSQIVIGSAIGARFAGLTGKMVWRGIRHAAGSSAMMLVAAFAATAALAPLVGLAFAPVLLAFAPGGFAEMILIALALNVDTAYVSTHHLFRIFLIVLAVPALFRMMAWFGIRKEAAKRMR